MKKLIIIITTLSLFNCGNDSIESILKRNNEISGTMLDVATKFVKAYTLGNDFYYEYSMNNCKEDQSEFANMVFEKGVSENLIKQINSLEEFKIIGDKNYDIIFKYTCDDGRSISEINFKFMEGKFVYKRTDSEFNESVDKMYDVINN